MSKRRKKPGPKIGEKGRKKIVSFSLSPFAIENLRAQILAGESISSTVERLILAAIK